MFRTCVAALALALMSTPASAAVFLSFNGSTGVFGNDLTDSPTFEDTFDLGELAPGQYLISATLSSTYQDGEQADQDIDFTTALLNGVEFEIGSTGQNEYRFINNIASGATNLFTIRGTSGLNSSYSGTINVASIPEPETWAMAMIGFFVVGAAMRRRPTPYDGLPQAV
jgi:hypothetical protein